MKNLRKFIVGLTTFFADRFFFHRYFLFNKHCLKNEASLSLTYSEGPRMDLKRCFAEWNLKSFNGNLPLCELRWNPRLKTTAGRFIPARRARFGFTQAKPIIEVATYLLDIEDGENLIRDTMGHEMIHYWLWVFRMPYGHTRAFHAKMNEIGVSRYNPVPQHRPFKHCYICDGCEQKIFTRKRLPKAACAACCNQHSSGNYHPNFVLRLEPHQPASLEIANQLVAKTK